ncbi:MAG: hypothetical protein GY906_18040 [bacterium]|nr:hypothetical protein [bacterium]
MERRIATACIIVLLLGCDDEPIPTAPREHYVAGPKITGPAGGLAPYSACWSVSADGHMCTYGHPTRVGIRIDGNPSPVGDSDEECRSDIQETLTIRAVAECTEDPTLEGTTTLNTSIR